MEKNRNRYLYAFVLLIAVSCSHSKKDEGQQGGGQVTPTPGATTSPTPTPTSEPGVNLLKRSDLVILSGDINARTDTYTKLLAVQTKALLDNWLHPKINILGFVSRGLAQSKAHNMEPFIDQDYKDEMTMLSQKLGVDYMDLLLGNIAPDLGQLIVEWNFFGCSTFAVLPSRSATGAMLVGRNLDYRDSQVLRSYWTPVLFEVPNKLRFFSIHLPGQTGVLTGINEKGVMVSIKVSHGASTSDGTPALFILRKIMENAKTADEAVTLYAAQSRTVALNIQISDPQNAYELEIDAKSYEVRRPSQYGIVYGANHFDSDMMRNSEKSRDFRWPIMAAQETTGKKLALDDLKTVIANVAGLDPDMALRMEKNILAVFVVYGANLKETAVYFGGDPEHNGISARGTLKKVFFSDLFP